MNTLNELLKNLQSPDDEVRITAAHQLGHSRDLEVARPLINALNQTTNPELQQAIIWALGRLGGSEALQKLTELALSEVKHIRDNSLLALQMAGDTSITPLLLELLEHSEFNTRQLTAETIAKIGDSTAVPSLLSALEQEKDDHVAGMIVYALGELRASEATPVFLRFLKEGITGNVRISIVRALGKIRATSAVPSLIPLLNHESEFLQETVVEALREIGTQEALAAIHGWPRRSSSQ